METALATGEVRAQGWYSSDDGGTKFWGGERWTGDTRPPRKPFAAASSNRGGGIALTVIGVLFVLTSPAQFNQPQTEASAPPIASFFVAVVIGLALIAWGIYLLRGQGPSTKSVTARLRDEQLKASRNAPPPRTFQNSAQTVHINIASSSTDTSAAAAQVQAIANPETARALENLQKLLYTRTITDEEFQAAKDKLLRGS